MSQMSQMSQKIPMILKNPTIRLFQRILKNLKNH